MSHVAIPTESMTVPSFRARKGSGTPLVVLTAYDAATTAAAEGGGADAILVGDSLGMVVLGYDSTCRSPWKRCSTTPGRWGVPARGRC